ncbi:MAG: HTTM domain-containing protein, partial [Anaerolineales bacterium]|nr:HTTM domain-containing protein [Anaerolineales bacterium]
LYRLSMVSFFLLFTYIELLDKAYYLNHYYLISVLSFLLIFLPLNGAWSLDVRWGLRRAQPFVPAWLVWLVRMQLGLVYFYAGVAKLNTDWLLTAQPLTIWLRARTAVPLIGPWLDYRWVAYLMSWAGLLFDLTVPFWLSWSRSRAPAYGTVVVFHLLTGLLFPIGLFPYIMIGLTLVFFPWTRGENEEAPAGPAPTLPRPATILLGLVLASQLLLPWRHLLYPGLVNWTEEGFRYAWRVMLVEKTGSAVFTQLEPATGRSQLILPGDYLTGIQEKQMSFQPDMIQQFAHFLEVEAGHDVVITAEVFVSWNGRGSRPLIDPKVDLTAQPVSLAHRPWILQATPP